MKKEYSVLEEIFIEEYDRIIRRINAAYKEIEALPKGSISKKNINGSEAFYLFYREGDKVKSKYIKKSDVENIKALVERRRHYEKIIRDSKKQKKQLEKVLGKETINEYKSGTGIS